MTGMRRTELVEDTMRARAILEEGLAIPIRTLAYPYGAENEFVRRVIKRLDFRAAVSCGPGISQLGDNPLRLPRIEVPGGARQSVCSHRLTMPHLPAPQVRRCYASKADTLLLKVVQLSLRDDVRAQQRDDAEFSGHVDALQGERLREDPARVRPRLRQHHGQPRLAAHLLRKQKRAG